MAPPAQANIPENRQLPSKEAGLFKQVLQQYETKQWKKGLKTTQEILKKHPNHGETLCMKGLFLTCTDQREEGYELVRKGVRLDFKSHICWHVYGLLYRADKNYDQAIKCYLQASRLEKDSLNILGDLALLQVHVRDYSGFVDTRLQMLKAAPRYRRYWIALAIGYHLAGQLGEAERVLRHLHQCIKPNRAEYEHSETLLYHAEILAKAGMWEKGLELLEGNSQHIVDRQSYSSLRSQCLTHLDRGESAQWAWSLLFEENSDSYRNIIGYLSCKGFSLDSPADLTSQERRTKILSILDELAQKHPSRAVKRLALDLAYGDEFRQRLEKYATDSLRKGVPSLFSDLRPLYRRREKRETIQICMESLRKTFEQDEIDPTAYLWTLYFLSQHYSHISQHRLALSLVDSCLLHTPTLPELHVLKARILKRVGNPQRAAKSMLDAKELDNQDRFLNTKAAKYLLRADRIKEAIEVCKTFTKPDAPSPDADLLELQALWFLQEEGDSHFRNKNYHEALKRYNQISKIYDDIWEDQLDFHTYCARKATIRAYVDMIQLEDRLHGSEGYQQMAQNAVIANLAISDMKSEANGMKNESEPSTKAVTKAKKENEENRKTDSDDASKPLPPLEAAQALVTPLQREVPRRAVTWLTSFEVALHENKFLQALRAYNHGRALEPKHPQLLLARERLKDAINNCQNTRIKNLVDSSLQHS